MSHRASVTGLSFLASLHAHVHVIALGAQRDIAWAEARIHEEWSEEYSCLVLERTEPACDGEAEVQVRYINNPSTETMLSVKRNPESVWGMAVEVAT